MGAQHSMGAVPAADGTMKSADDLLATLPRTE